MKTSGNPFFSAAMIVKNEESFLEDCLASIGSIVDEIVVVDTGSTDGTQRIAEKFGARVFEFAWQDNFSAARNAALMRCAGEWILYIDADERMSPADPSKITRLLRDPGKIAYTVRFHPLTGYTAYREYRIFRNDPRIRFEGIIHETIVRSLQSAAKADGRDIGDCDLTIRHLGYDGNPSWKHRRNLPMLKEQIQRDPKRVYLWWHLGVVLNATGDVEGAEQAWEAAVDVIRRNTHTDPRDCQPYYELIRLRYERGHSDWKLLQEAESRFPENYLIMWMKGKILMHTGRFDEAVSLFRELIAVNPDFLAAGAIAYDARIFKELSYEPLATCYYKLKRYEQSEAYYALALQCDPENDAYRTKLRFLKTRVATPRSLP